MDGWTKRLLVVVAPPVLEVHTHTCDGCGASYSCTCGDAGQEYADCGGCKRDDVE